MTDWSALEHAYGPATDVPDLLTELEGGNRRAVGALANRVAHQGWASTEVATATVPHLWRIARSVPAVRGAVALLLGDLACLGDHLHFTAGGLGRDAMADGMLAQEGYAALRAAVVAEADAALEWLEDSSAPTRSGAALLLAVTQPAGALERLSAAAARERSRAPRSDLYLATGWFEGADLALLRKGLARKTPDRFGAAVALAMRDQLDDQIVGALLHPGALKGSAWAAGAVAEHGLKVLIAACGRAGDAAPLYAAMGDLDAGARTAVATELIKHEFADAVRAHAHPAQPRPTPPLADLTPAQRTLLVALSGQGAGWGRSDMTYWLEYLGFWANPVQLRAYLGIPEARTVLDEPSALPGDRGTWRDRLVADLEGGAGPVALAQAVAAHTCSADAVALAELAPRHAHGDFPAALRFRLHLMVAQGDPAPLRARIDALCGRKRPVTYWRTRDGRHYYNSGDAYLEDMLFVALRRLDPAAKWPEGLRVDRRTGRGAQEDPRILGETLVGWMAQALG